MSFNRNLIGDQSFPLEISLQIHDISSSILRVISMSAKQWTEICRLNMTARTLAVHTALHPFPV